MGCEAAICRTPLGARIIAGRRSLKEPQYAWDYASVRLADKALAYAEFNTHPTEGIIGVEDTSVVPIRQQNLGSTCVGGDIPPRGEWRGCESGFRKAGLPKAALFSTLRLRQLVQNTARRC